MTLIKLKEDDQILQVERVSLNDQLVVATSNGRMLRVAITDDHLPVQARTTQGQLVMRLGKREHLVGGATVSLGGQVLMVTEKGYAKRTPVATMRLSHPGDLGAQGLQFASKTDTLVGLVGLRPETEVLLLTTGDRAIRPQLDTIPMQGRETTGDRLCKLEKDEKITTVLRLSNRPSLDPDPS